MSITDIISKIKGHWASCKKEDIFIAFIIVLVGFSGYGLGKLSVLSEMKTPIKIVDENVIESSVATSSGAVVASKSGTKYFLPYCTGANTIKENNKIWFQTEAEAKSAGYEPALNCKGLSQ